MSHFENSNLKITEGNVMTDEKKIDKKKKEKITICSIDIGSKNFAFCIEKFNLTKLQNIRSQLPPRKSWFDSDGVPNPSFQEVLEKVWKNGKVKQFEVMDLTEGGKLRLFETKVLINMSKELNKRMELFDKCNIIIVEQQMQFGRKRNTIALKLMQHCISFFLHKYGMEKPIIEFPAYFKTKLLGCPRTRECPKKKNRVKMNKYWRKKWAVEMAKVILTARDDLTNLQVIEKNKKKADDLSDTLIQAQSFKIAHYLEGKKWK